MPYPNKKMKSIPYNCQFCNRPGVTQFDEGVATPVVLKRWLPYLSCPRCFKFYEAKRESVEKIKAICHALIIVRCSQDKDKDRVEAVLRTRLSNRIEEYSGLVCDYLGIETVRDESFLESVFSHPKMYHSQVTIYFKGLHKQFHKRYESEQVGA